MTWLSIYILHETSPLPVNKTWMTQGLKLSLRKPFYKILRFAYLIQPLSIKPYRLFEAFLYGRMGIQ